MPLLKILNEESKRMQKVFQSFNKTAEWPDITKATAYSNIRLNLGSNTLGCCWDPSLVARILLSDVLGDFTGYWRFSCLNGKYPINFGKHYMSWW